ncbi:MAG: exodeoxyribonuclease VII small subunit [Rhodospirillaceae bacterium]|nr:exodeoxyribonuclease VII small subunit [Rhodospirillaceae bacterium]|tara:strand:+ start:9556 stop:9807 length:252 start_codon:yes stop_codon:yes gene_type:complete
MAKSDKKADIASLSFEGALAELEEIVRKLEQGKSDLEDALGAYERGAALKKHCETKLKEAKARVEKIKMGADGAGGLEPTNLE